MNHEADTATGLRARALRLLARREHSRAELGRKLAPHAESEEALAVLLSDLESKRQLSDARFASERARQLARKYGAARIRQDLKARGVDPQLIAGLGADDELDRARAILARKYREPAATREERARRSRFLQARGFSLDVVYALLGRSVSGR